LLFCVDFSVALGNDLLVLRQYSLLDHIPRFSIGRKSNIPIGPFASWQEMRRTDPWGF
jgi:hypothetical protein